MLANHHNIWHEDWRFFRQLITQKPLVYLHTVIIILGGREPAYTRRDGVCCFGQTQTSQVFVETGIEVDVANCLDMIFSQQLLPAISTVNVDSPRRVCSRRKTSHQLIVDERITVALPTGEMAVFVGHQTALTLIHSSVHSRVIGVRLPVVSTRRQSPEPAFGQRHLQWSPLDPFPFWVAAEQKGGQGWS